ncbi:MAG TPA: hypothetical protein VGI78_09130 [Acetobacteraceae bacterium]
MQRLIASYHKTGTTLMADVMGDVADALGWKLQNLYGLVRKSDIDPGADIVLLPHALLDFTPIGPDQRVVRLIRDPRDIWVSSYCYHLRCDEDWCTGRYTDLSAPILWPRVDFPLEHRAEAWKRDYLESLAGFSYQETLRSLDQDQGLVFEHRHCTSWTLDAMRQWRAGGCDVKLEDFARNYEMTWHGLFCFLLFPPRAITVALNMARRHDIAHMTDAQIAAHRVASRRPSDWRRFLTLDQAEEFETIHRDLILSLGYPLV